MKDKLRDYIEELFKDAPPTKKTVDMKEEILQNLNEKYKDLVSEGKSEQAAYNIAAASIGDISELIRELKGTDSAQFEAAIEENKYIRRSALLTAIAVGIYILSIVPLFLLGNNIGLILLFVFAAIATAILIFNNMTKPESVKTANTIAEEFKEWRESTGEKRRAYKSISSAVWALTVVVYFLISFTTHAWHITWIIFLVAGAINSIVKAIFDWKA